MPFSPACSFILCRYGHHHLSSHQAVCVKVKSSRRPSYPWGPGATAFGTALASVCALFLAVWLSGAPVRRFVCLNGCALGYGMVPYSFSLLTPHPKLFPPDLNLTNQSNLPTPSNQPTKNNSLGPRSTHGTTQSECPRRASFLLHQPTKGVNFHHHAYPAHALRSHGLDLGHDHQSLSASHGRRRRNGADFDGRILVHSTLGYHTDQTASSLGIFVRPVCALATLSYTTIYAPSLRHQSPESSSPGGLPLRLFLWALHCLPGCTPHVGPSAGV